MQSGTILMVEDDTEIAELVTLYLHRQGYEVIVVDNWSAVDILKGEQVDLVLLDVMLPQTNGFDLCQEFRRLSDVPILFMSAKTDDSDKILGLSLGADDFVTKPFSPAELVARVNAQLRRYRTMASRPVMNRAIFRARDLEIDENSFTVKTNQGTVVLSIKEFQILKLMAQNPQKVFMPDELYGEIWKTPVAGDARTVMVHISNLRKKIETDPSRPTYIVTIRGLGYQFVG